MKFIYCDATTTVKNKKIVKTGIYVAEDNLCYSRTINLNKDVNSNEAEKEAIEHAIHISVSNGYKEVVIINDNKSSIENFQKNFDTEFKDIKKYFNSIQFLWLPRDYTNIADTLCKMEHQFSHQLKEELFNNGNSKNINTPFSV